MCKLKFDPECLFWYDLRSWNSTLIFVRFSQCPISPVIFYGRNILVRTEQVLLILGFYMQKSIKHHVNEAGDEYPICYIEDRSGNCVKLLKNCDILFVIDMLLSCYIMIARQRASSWHQSP